MKGFFTRVSLPPFSGGVRFFLFGHGWATDYYASLPFLNKSSLFFLQFGRFFFFFPLELYSPALPSCM